MNTLNTTVNATTTSPVTQDDAHINDALQQELLEFDWGMDYGEKIEHQRKVLREFDWDSVPRAEPSTSAAEQSRMQRRVILLQRLTDLQSDLIRNQDDIIAKQDSAVAQNEDLLQEVRQLDFKVMIQCYFIAAIVILVCFLRLI